MKKLIFLFFFITTIKVYSRTEEGISGASSQLKKGNLSLSTSQQPGPIFSFGQNIVDKKDLQLFTYVDDLNGKRKNFFEIAPSVLYGITDACSIFITVPYAASFKLNNSHSSGIEDILVQGEYAAYSKDNKRSSDQITIVGRVSLPFGSISKNPSTGLGSVSIFLGSTLSHMGIHWYAFTSFGGLINTPHNNQKAANQFLYQAGFGRNIASPKGWIFLWLVELNGYWSEKNKVNIHFHRNLGGNAIFIGPSIWISSKRLIIQAGIEFATYQKVEDDQNKSLLFAAINIGWKF